MFARRSARLLGQTAWRSLQAGSRRSYATAQAETAPPRRSSGRGGLSLLISGVAFTGLGASTTWYVLTQNGLGFYSDEASLTRFTATDDEARRAEETINRHPLVAALRGRADLAESRPHMKMPRQYRDRSLTGGALLGPGRLAVPPYTWTDAGGRSLVSVSYVGGDLCGHPGIVHGGFLATMLDEGMARCCFAALPHGIGVTANLDIDYRRPAPAGSFFVLRAETTRVEGRKAWVRGHIELLGDPGTEPVILAEATALFISPKYAAMMPRIG